MDSAASFPDQARTLGSLLRGPYRKLSQQLYAEVAAHGFPEIRPSHSAVLRHLAPGGSRLTDLAEQADLTKQSMAYLVGYLEEHGYLKVQPDPHDGRAKRVRLTAKGGRLMNALMETSARLEARAARSMGRRELEALRRGLAALDAAIDEE